MVQQLKTNNNKFIHLLTYGLSDTENYFSGSQNSIAASVSLSGEKKFKREGAGGGGMHALDLLNAQ